MNIGYQAPAHGRTPKSSSSVSKTGRNPTVSFYQMHWYQAAWLFVTEAILDTRCLEQSPFDMAYLTEIDPLWADSEATFVLNPDAGLFTSIAASAACAADCVQSSISFGNELLWWCAGCQGRLFPLSGWVTEHIGGIQAAALLTQRFTAKLHREGLQWAAYGAEGQCGHYIQPLMDKRAYKYHLVYPVRSTEKFDGRCCYPYGRTTMFWQGGKEFPIGGEDFVIQVWRKRDCCQGASYP
jgi:conjugal transfer pilus assembly protein TraU